jgi:hypothetical protein
MAGAARVAIPVGGNPVTSSRLMSFVFPDSGATVAKPDTLLGVSAYETAGTSAKFRLRDGIDVTGTLLGTTVPLTANALAQLLSYPNGVQILSGSVFVEWISGSIELVCYW